MQGKTTIYTAKRIITMRPEQPFARAVAVKDGRILGVGELEDLVYWIKKSPFTPVEVDTQFENKILMPGLVDAHTHPMSLAIEYANHFVAQVPWNKPDGGFFQTYGTKAQVLARLKEIDAQLPEGEVLWGVHYDDNQAGGFLSREELDTVSTTRPIFVSNMVFHRFWVNSALFRKAGVSLEAGSKKLEGVAVDENNIPDGNLLEMKGLSHVAHVLTECMVLNEERIRNILPLFRGQGITTVTELFLGGFCSVKGVDNDLPIFQNVFAEGTQSLRILAMPSYHNIKSSCGSFDAACKKIQSLKQDPKSYFQVHGAKLYFDGSIIAHTAPLDWPGYWDGSEGQHNANSAEDIREAIIGFHKAGIPTFTHTNSNIACQVVLDAVEEAQSLCYRPDIRHRMEHCYNITAAQLRRCKALGVAVQFFSSQLYYYGDGHMAIQGPDRGGQHLLPIGTAERLGVSWGMHVDPPGTPQLPWVAIWAAVMRQTLEGKILGIGERVSVEAALHAFTLEHAWQLHIENEVGSIEFGKKADFCVLEADPLQIDPNELKDMPVWGTVFEGTPCKAL